MGFSWSPWVAQCIATLIVVGLHPNAKGHDLSFETDEHITSVKRCKDSQERIIAVIILFYDNFLIVAESRRVYDKVKSKITACAAFLAAKWKLTPDAADPFLKADSEGWLVFLGFRFKTDAQFLAFVYDPDIVWYGPHACNVCGREVVKSSNDSGGVMLDAPQEHHYPNHLWRLHNCEEVHNCHVCGWPE